MEASAIRELIELPDRTLDKEIAECLGKRVTWVENPETGTADYHAQTFGLSVVASDEQWRQPLVRRYSTDTATSSELLERIDMAGEEAQEKHRSILRKICQDPANPTHREVAVAFLVTCRTGLVPPVIRW